jgi:hypothetical protein
MRILVNATVVSVENEIRIKVEHGSKFADLAYAILDVGKGGDCIVAKVYGRDRITVLKQKAVADKPVDLVLSITGKVHDGQYDNNLYVKWILS